MVNFYYLNLVKNLFEYNIFFILFSSVFCILLNYFMNIYSFENLNKVKFIINNLIKYFLLFILFLSFFINILTFIIFIKIIIINSNNLIYYGFYNNFSNLICLKIFLNFFLFKKLSIEFFGLIFIVLAYIVGFISYLALDTRIFWKNIKFMFTCNFLVIIIFFFVTVNDFLLLFLFYECLLIPSFLFVYYVSPYKRGVQGSLYFLIWTQLGSLLVLCSIVYLYVVTGNTSFFFLRSFVFTNDEIWFFYFLIFLGFGFKVPIWPFQYWLTKTHVEAPAGFSIFLSGFLVKTAVYGFYKITNELCFNLDTSFFSVFCIMGIIDGSLKMWGQLDLKKLVAYGTVQEMNIIYLSFLWGDSTAIIGGILFCITHAFLSSLMFFLVDCIQKRYNTRIVTEVSGILHTTPNLGLSILFMQILYSGLPGTLKFVSEFYIFSGLLSSSPFSLLLLIYVANFLGLIGFSKCWFNVVFGLTLKNTNKQIIDLNIKEVLVIFVCVFSMLFFGLSFNFFL